MRSVGKGIYTSQNTQEGWTSPHSALACLDTFTGNQSMCCNDTVQ